MGPQAVAAERTDETELQEYSSWSAYLQPSRPRSCSCTPTHILSRPPEPHEEGVRRRERKAKAARGGRSRQSATRGAISRQEVKAPH